MYYKTEVSKLIKDVELRQPPVIITVNEFNEEATQKFADLMCQAQNSGQKVIPVIIDSFGGQVYSLMSMISMIKASNVPVATIVQGKAMSCGAILASFGEKGMRYMDPYATMMIHDVSGYAFGKVEELKADARESERLNKKIYKMMSENCDRPEKYFTDLIHDKGHADWFLEAEEALKHGIIDHLKIPELKININVDISLE
jgi:ATP-dependent Clp protease protease subunit